jgi:hypothetical protein
MESSAGGVSDNLPPLELVDHAYAGQWFMLSPTAISCIESIPSTHRMSYSILRTLATTVRQTTCSHCSGDNGMSSSPPTTRVRCGRCQFAWYCSAECRQAALDTHKHECEAPPPWFKFLPIPNVPRRDDESIERQDLDKEDILSAKLAWCNTEACIKARTQHNFRGFSLRFRRLRGAMVSAV